MIQQTSLEAFEATKLTIGAKQLVVYERIKTFPMITAKQVALGLDWPINEVTGRITELVQMNLIQCNRIIIPQGEKRKQRAYVANTSIYWTNTPIPRPFTKHEVIKAIEHIINNNEAEAAIKSIRHLLKEIK